MAADGGGEGPEAVMDRLNVVNRMESLLGIAKLVVLIGDAHPHGMEPSCDNFTEGCPEALESRPGLHSFSSLQAYGV